MDYPLAPPRSFREVGAAERRATLTMQRSGPGASAAGGRGGVQRPLVGGGREGRAGTGGHAGTWEQRGAAEGRYRLQTRGDTEHAITHCHPPGCPCDGGSMLVAHLPNPSLKENWSPQGTHAPQDPQGTGTGGEPGAPYVPAEGAVWGTQKEVPGAWCAPPRPAMEQRRH